jgi:hypothetical protein
MCCLCPFAPTNLLRETELFRKKHSSFISKNRPPGLQRVLSFKYSREKQD